MAARPNAIGRRAPLPGTYDATLRDPARGEKVPRCQRCGMPERPNVKLYPGLWGYIRFNIDLTLCGECITELMPDRRALDPLTLDEVA